MKTKNFIALEGNQAVALAMKQIDPDVVAAYPITPQTEIVQVFSEYVANGNVHTEFVTVESEHSALSACIGSSAAGARVMTATSSQGLALMWEMLYIASGARLPIVMTVVNRALSSPINIHCDHSDAMGARDSGWIQLWSETAQEAYDNLIQAIKIAESINLPVMVNMDGFITSHAEEMLEPLEDEDVKKFIGEYKPIRSLLDVEHPFTVGPLALQDSYFEFKRSQAEAYKKVVPAVREAAEGFAKITGRKYDLFETYKLEDAEMGIIVLNSTAGTAKEVVDRLREDGKKVGLLKPRLFRPLPVEDLKKTLSHLKVIGVMDRADTFGGFGGPLFGDTRSVLYDVEHRPIIVDYIYGLGGRDVTMDQIYKVFEDLDFINRTGRVESLISYIGIRE
ncbi:MAG: pyruvate ferredoxin oxidoreductase [Dictyoglomi bacterium]|jgi:pyruvate ferredoxin oxidoreductase alpha subunit|nr:pyruvate ferredoxin oxidoreductase [Dictyoglomota bacterium]HHV80299.1 pyruvate ferredoxin oxidoreductase [bacterium]HRU31848.1 pyruvate ferredoxin oxidoreductase [bacterium]